jgi:hypothetical protein
MLLRNPLLSPTHFRKRLPVVELLEEPSLIWHGLEYALSVLFFNAKARSREVTKAASLWY